MGKLGATVSTITFLGALGACLAGCPVWDGGSGGASSTVYPTTDSGVDDTPPLTTTCTANSDCLNGYCDSTSHTCVTSTSCADGAACPSGYYCDSRSVCVPGCATSAQCPSGQYCSSGTCAAGCTATSDCTRVSPGLVCNVTSNQCAPSGLCSSNSDCASTPNTPVCLGGTCQAVSNQCQFDYQCTGGAECVNGQCLQGCSAASTTNCASGQVCVNDFCQYPSSGTCTTACATGTLCVSGACLATCSTNANCATGQVCTGGVCRVDTSPHPACTVDGDCAPNSVCFHGACRVSCPTNTSAECMRTDVELDVCTAEPTGQHLCSSSSEAMPQCGSPYGSTTPLPACPAGQVCVDARCQ